MSIIALFFGLPAAGLGKFAKKMAKAPDEAFGGAGAARELRAMADGLVRQWKAQVNEEAPRLLQTADMDTVPAWVRTHPSKITPNSIKD